MKNKIRQCKGITSTGRRCKHAAVSGKKFCRRHLPPNYEETDIELEKALKIARPVSKITLLEIGITVVIFVFTWTLFQNGKWLTTIIQIENSTAIEFFSAISQALGALVGFLIGFLIFVMQFIDQAKRQAYNDYKNETRQLSYLMINCPANLQAILLSDLDKLVGFLASLELRDLPKCFREADKRLKDFGKSWKQANDSERDPLNRYYLHQLCWNLKNIEEDLSKLKVQHVSFKAMPYEFLAVPKMLFLIGASLLLLLSFGIVDIQDILPDLRLPLIFSTVAWLIMVLIELHSEMRYLLKNFIESWRWA